VNGETGAVQLNAADVGARPSTWTPSAADVGADPAGTADAAVSNHNVDADAHNDIRLLIEGLESRLNALADSDDTTLDQMSEIVAYIKANKTLIDSITTSKINVYDIINNLTTNVSNKPLSAAQGVILKGLIDSLSTGKLDVTAIADWAKAATKPSYTKNEVGLGNVDNVKQYSASNPPPYPVTSVNGKTGAVTVAVPEIVQATGDSASAVMSQKAVTDAIASLEQVQLEFVDSVEEMTDTSKFYVMDGFIYAYMLTDVEAEPSYTNVLPLAINADGTPYVGTNGEKGYKVGWRINSSAVEKEEDGRCCTGFIAAKPSDTIRIKNMYHPTDNNMNGYLVIYSSAFAKIASGYEGTAFKFVNGECEFVVNNATMASGTVADMAYFRISTGIIDDTSIITINQPITEGGGTTTGYAWANTGRAFVPADYEDRIISLENDVDVLKKTVENISKEEAVDKIALIKAWDAPIYDANIPVFQLSAEKAAMTNAAQAPADIYARYDALMAKHPNYITKTDLGLCSDGVNHVYRYDFREPDSRHTSGYDWSETKTKAIIVSGIHFEWSGIYGLYYALEEIAENPELFKFRRNSHLIVVPCMNPYATIADNYQSGLATPNSYGVRNANGVEIHRNFEVGWALTEEGTTHYGGAEPLSEVETQYVDTIMKENTDAALFLTCHSFADTSFNFIWPSVATKYMCNMGYRLIDKLSNAWMETHRAELIGLEDYRGDDIPAWDNRLGFAHISKTPGTETRQGTKYGIQSANVEICGRFWTHGTAENPEPNMSSFTMSRGAEVYVNFLLTVFGCYDYKDKAEYGG
jgi:hypothetical protein